MHALLVGGTGFIGRHTSREFLDHGYSVATLSRGNHEIPHAHRDEVTTYRGHRDDRDVLERVADDADPDVVVDLVGYHPHQVETATEVFADADAYVFVSSASAYDPLRLPSREGDPLHEFTAEHEGDDSMASYGPRKAECDRVCFRAAEAGVPTMVVRPVCVYGPHDHSGRHDYWFHRVKAYDEVLVPGDGDSTFHRVYVEDLARAFRVVAERGDPGEAYNAAERQTAWLDRTIDLAAETLDTEVEPVHASPRELAPFDVAPTDFPLYLPVPAVAASEKLADLGWTSTPLEETFERTVVEFLESGRTGMEPEAHEHGIDRDTEETIIDELAA